MAFGLWTFGHFDTSAMLTKDKITVYLAGGSAVLLSVDINFRICDLLVNSTSSRRNPGFLYEGFSPRVPSQQFG